MPDVNILVNAHRSEAVDHARYGEWIKELASSPEPFALSESVLHGFVRVATNPRAFAVPSPLADALEFLDQLIALPTCRLTRPGPDHWTIFRELCALPGVRGKLVADAAHAALAIESGCEWVTADTDFARFAPPLRWRHL